MRPGDIATVVVTVLNGGAPVTGLVTANFAVAYYLDATTPSAAFTVTEIGSGRYRVALTMPATIGYLTLFITSVAGYTVQNGRYWGQLEAQDLTSLYAVVVRPVAQLTGASALASEVQLNLNANRYKTLTVTVVDQNGVPVDLSGYTNWRFSVWDQKHLASIYLLNSGITGSALGVVSWAIPENATFFSQIDAAIAQGNNTLVLYYDMIADAGGVAADTSCIFRGTVVLTRYEGAA